KDVGAAKRESDTSHQPAHGGGLNFIKDQLLEKGLKTPRARLPGLLPILLVELTNRRLSNQPSGGFIDKQQHGTIERQSILCGDPRQQGEEEPVDVAGTLNVVADLMKDRQPVQHAFLGPQILEVPDTADPLSPVALE